MKCIDITSVMLKRKWIYCTLIHTPKKQTFTKTCIFV